MARPKTVGRNRPPRKKQFGRGQKRSHGRPKGALGEKTITQKIASELHDFEQNGIKRRVTTYELLLIRMRGLAMEAHLGAAKWLSDYVRSQNIEPDQVCGFLVVPGVLTAEEWTEQAHRFNALHQENPEDRYDPILQSMFSEDQLKTNAV